MRSTLSILGLLFVAVAAFISVDRAIGQVKSEAAKPARPATRPTPKPTPKPAPTARRDTKPTQPQTEKKVVPRPDERADRAKLDAMTSPDEKLAAAREFIAAYPNSKRLDEVRSMIAAIEFNFGDEALKSSDTATASTRYKSAVAALPATISSEIFEKHLSKMPLELFFAGGRAEALEIVRMIEERVSTDAARLRSIAEFYLNVENGTEARRVIDLSLDIEPGSAVGYMLLGLAERIDFRFAESSAAFAKAVEIDPDNNDAKRGLAEMKRATGDAATAAALYREIIAAESDNMGARTGLVLSLLESGDKDADSVLETELTAMPDNVLLLGGAAYAYAARNDGSKAVQYAQRAVTADPRFIWSHIALARGLMLQRDPVSAEKVLLAAGRFGNFPTLDYELASVRVAIGFYREAADDLARSFTVADGKVSTLLGGRVQRSSARIDELVGYERRASIFAPTAADSPANATLLASLLQFRIESERENVDVEAAVSAGRNLIGSADPMRIYRRLFVVQKLLDKGAPPETVLDIVRASTDDVDSGLQADVPAAAILAAELYDSRQIALRRGEYIRIPDVPRQTLSAILRGRVEELNGAALAKLDRHDEAVIRFRRAIGVLPVDSSMWRSSYWRLAASLEASGKVDDALDAYIKSYAGGPTDVFRYRLISQLYKTVKGSFDGLEERIGPDPAPPTAIATAEPTVTPTPTDAGSTTDAEPSETKDEGDPDESQTPTPTPTPDDEPVREDESTEPTPTPTPVAETPAREPNADEKQRPRMVTDGDACEFYVSEEVMTLRASGGGLALIVGRKDDGDIEGLTVTASNADDILIRKQNTPGVTSRAVYVVSSKSGKPGLYYVRLDLPCARRDVVIQVR